ncbi:hypothetical protein VCHC57A1_3108, partial [Vibrio cholerae HC-57A1]
MKLNLKALDT